MIDWPSRTEDNPKRHFPDSNKSLTLPQSSYSQNAIRDRYRINTGRAISHPIKHIMAIKRQLSIGKLELARGMRKISIK